MKGSSIVEANICDHGELVTVAAVMATDVVVGSLGRCAYNACSCANRLKNWKNKDHARSRANQNAARGQNPAPSQLQSAHQSSKMQMDYFSQHWDFVNV